jgi:hypothetical protein
MAFASVLVGFGSIDLQASDGFINTSYFYTNNLTNQISVRQDFDRLGGGFGSFEVNSQTGLELLSEAPNSYQGVRVLRATLSTARSWQVVVKAHVQLAEDPNEEHRDARDQLQSHYGAYLGVVKLVRNSDGSPSIVDSAPNRASVVLRKSDGGGWQHYFAFGRYSGGVKVGEETINPLGNQPEVLLRLRFSAADRSLIVGYSIDNGQEFSELPSVDLGTEWGLTPDDELVVTLEGNSSPYSTEDRDNDFWSTFDRDASITPAPLPVYSVRSGEIFFSDLGIAYEPSQIADFTYETVNGSEIVVTGYTGSEAHVSVPQFINGLPVTKISYSVFSEKENLTSVLLPHSVLVVESNAFANSPNLNSVYLPANLRAIGGGVFAGATSLRRVNLPPHLVLRTDLWLDSGLAFQQLVQLVGNALAENELFMAALVTNEKFLGALSAKILSRYGSYGLAARGDLSEFATRQDVQNGLEQSRAQGINSVIADPNSWNLFTADQVSGLSIGDLTLTRQVNGSFVLNYDIEQSDDLVNWTTYRNYGEELTGLPTNKKFIRIRVKQ